MNTSLVPFGTRHPSLLGDFRRDMDNLMERFLGEEESRELSNWFRPTANISETDESYQVSLDLPGIKPEEIDVELKHGELWITGERKEESEKKEKTWHRVESRYGSFQRVIRLGEDLDGEKVDAEFKDGVLRITVPKTEASRTKHVEVKC